MVLNFGGLSNLFTKNRVMVEVDGETPRVEGLFNFGRDTIFGDNFLQEKPHEEFFRKDPNSIFITEAFDSEREGFWSLYGTSAITGGQLVTGDSNGTEHKLTVTNATTNTFTAKVKITATDNAKAMHIGFGDSVLSGFANIVAFEKQIGVATWRGVTYTGGLDDNTGNFSLTIGTWYELKVVFNAAGAEFFVDGVSKGTTITSAEQMFAAMFATEDNSGMTIEWCTIEISN